MEHIKARFLIEDEILEDNIEELKASLDSNGNPYKFTKYFKVLEDGNDHNFGFSPDDGPVVFIGSLNMSKYMMNKTTFLPGPFCNLKNFEYVRYAPYYGDLLLNSDWVCLPLREAIRQRNFLFMCFKQDNWGTIPDAPIFVRPVAGDKPFAGRVLNYEDFNLKGFYHGYYFDDLDLPIVISSAKNVGRELRYFIGDKTILSSSEYGAYKKGVNYNQAVENPDEFVKQIIKTVDWQPEEIYTIDIVEWQSHWKVAEINGASTSGIYECNTDPIIKSLSATAERMWKEIYET